MKKIIGYIGSYLYFYLGVIVHKISYIKIKGEFFFDKPKYMRIGMYLAGMYQRLMHKSHLVQRWAGNSKPWRKIV